MIKSKIPLPSKRSAQSSIPLPTKCLGKEAKKLPLNTNEAIVSVKPASVKQVLPKSSKDEEKDKNSVKRLPSTVSRESTIVTQKKPHDAKRGADLYNKPKTGNKLIKQIKPAPFKQVLPKSSKDGEKDKKSVKRLPFTISHDSTIMTQKKSSSKPHDVKRVAGLNRKPMTENKHHRSKSVPGKENQSKRFSSFKPHADKKTVLSNIEPKATNKSNTLSKTVNQPKFSTKISTNSLKEKTNKNVTINEKAEKVAVVEPIRQTNLMLKTGVNDSEFKDSCFFKEMILSQRELSPGIMKICSEAKFSSAGVNANLLQPQQKFSQPYQSADEFVEEVKRNSSKYFRLNGKLVLQSPFMVKYKEKSAEDFVEEVRRNSARFQQRKGNLLYSHSLYSPLVPNNSLYQRMAQDIVSVKENLDVKLVDEVRRLSEIKRQTSNNVDSSMGSRRWTCNVPSKPSIANMKTSEIGAELQRLSEIRRESGAPLFKKATFLEQCYSVGKLNPHQKALKELESLTAKKRDKIKKKVAFFIPSPGSPDLATALTTKTETKLSDISEGSSQNCTPELILDGCKVKINSQSGDSAKNSEDTSIITTPELNFGPYKFNFDSSPKEINATLSFDLSHENNISTNNSSDSQTVSLEVVENISKSTTEQCSQTSCANLDSFKSAFLSSKLSSLEISDNNVCNIQDRSNSDLTSLGNYLTNIQDTSYSEFSKLNSTDCLFPSVHKLAVPSNYPLVNETEKFCLNAERKICTPHPVAFYSKSNLPPSVSPSFLSGKFSTLNSYAPICTPLVLKSFARSPEVHVSHVRQRLDFNEKSNFSMERRESQIILQTIPTIQKMNDFLCDQECIILSSQSSEEDKFFRNLRNPIATILDNGDEMHFVPVNSP